MKKKLAPKWSAKARPVDDAGRARLHELEDGGNQAVEKLFLRIECTNSSEPSIAAAALEVLLFVRAAERGAVDLPIAKRLAARLRKVLDGETWNQAFDAPWTTDLEKEVRLALRDFDLAKAFEAKLTQVRKRRPTATIDEVEQHVARDKAVSVGTLRAARAWCAKATKKTR